MGEVAPAQPRRAAATSGIRPDIQALRAVAITLVVMYHFWPGSMPGGFVGVDVFFGVSGFLITSMLLREIDRTGRLSLPGFWGRRVRRILPAALLTLLFCAVMTFAFVPLTDWRQYFDDMQASTAYVQNWHLASVAVNYFTSGSAATPVQHFWTLSIEEQFYIAWPILLTLAIVLTRARSPRTRRQAIGVMMAALTLSSLFVSWRETIHNPAAAYFVTTTRAWELGLGGLLALAAPVRGRESARTALAWLGLAAIGASGALYSDATPFPGLAALVPVGGTLAVIYAAAPARAWAPMPFLRLAPVQLVGDTSYSIYLWHWPLLMFAPFVIHTKLTTSTTFIVLMLTLLIAWLSKTLVEDPIRKRSFLVRRPLGWTFCSGALAMALVMGVALGGSSYVQAKTRKQVIASQHAAAAAAAAACFGAASLAPGHPCHNPKLRTMVVPTPLAAASMPNAPCLSVHLQGAVNVCGFGYQGAHPAATVALIGDSHASQWRAALQVVAERERWRGVSLAHTSCPLSTKVPEISEPSRSSCLQWRRQLPKWLAAHPEISIAFVSDHIGGRVLGAEGRSQFEAKEQGYLGAWRQLLPASIRHIVVIRDTPEITGETLTCVEQAISRHEDAGVACELPRSSALGPDPQVAAAQQLHSARVNAIDLASFFCSSEWCWPVIGGALVYKDVSHLTTTYAVTLAPYLQQDIDAVLRRRS
jgi:peptidoglycan/LPS O-acetylase OafA/YrhL